MVSRQKAAVIPEAVVRNGWVGGGWVREAPGDRLELGRSPNGVNADPVVVMVQHAELGGVGGWREAARRSYMYMRRGGRRGEVYVVDWNPPGEITGRGLSPGGTKPARPGVRPSRVHNAKLVIAVVLCVSSGGGASSGGSSDSCGGGILRLMTPPSP